MAAEQFIVWHDDFGVGNTSIDEQHRELFELVNQMWHSRKESDKKKKELFKKIIKTLHEHCEEEEGILERNGCPSLEEHRHEHRKLVKQIREVLDSCNRDSKKTWYNMMAFLMHELLSRHLVGTDLRCREYLAE